MRGKVALVQGLLAVLGVTSALLGSTTASAEPVTLRLATQDSGTAWYFYGAAISPLLQRALPSGSRVDVLPYAGANANPKLVEQGKADLALTFRTPAVWALEGVAPYDHPYRSLRALVGGLDQYYMAVIVRSKMSGVSVDDIVRKKMSLRLVGQQKGSLGGYTMEQIIRAAGGTFADIKAWGGSVVETPARAAGDMLRDGKADVWFQVVTPGHPVVTELSVGGDLRFLSLSPSTVEKLTKAGYSAAEMPAGMFKGLEAPVKTVGFPTILFTTDQMSADIAYLITKALCENAEVLGRGHAGLRAFVPEAAWRPERTGLPLHAGAERYYRERGWLK